MIWLAIGLTGAAYALAWRPRLRVVGQGRGFGLRHRQAVAFAGGLLLWAVVSSPAADALAQRFFWAVCAQRMLLVMAVAPLLCAGAPAAVLCRSLPGAAALARRAPRLYGPVAGFLAVNLAMWAAAIPGIMALLLRSPVAHLGEQLLFVALGVLFWAQVIDQLPRRSGLSHLKRATYLLLASTQQRVLGLVLGFAQTPFYAHYVGRLGQAGALTDQQVGAGILLVPGVLTDTVALTVCFFLWLNDDAHGKSGARTRAELAAAPGWRPRS
ncbi:MAG TPA: cytochrome c oxidase assembly protein [Candidatus Limnocylindrales bacterium]|nr:cytochrome c oxidase assembly protein [Candidatus Limnocylindrales bacterium]